MTDTRSRIALEVLASIPFTFGFQPTESVVVTAMRFEPGFLTIEASARLDLAGFTDADHLPVVDHSLSGLARTGAPAGLVTVHTDRPVGSWVLDLVDLMTGRWPFPDHAGYHVLGRGAVYSFAPDGEPIGVLDALELLTTEVAMSQPACSFLDGPDGFRFRRTPDGVAAEMLADRLGELGRSQEGVDWSDRTSLWWDTVERGSAIGTDVQAVLLHALDHVPFRDGVLAAAVSGRARVATDLRTVDPECVDDSATPDRQFLARIIGVLASLSHDAPPGRAITPMAMAAYLAWWSGDGARARVMCEQAWEEDPSNSLAGLVRRALERACPPPWFVASHKPSDWARHG